jgi:hypothetical protein
VCRDLRIPLLHTGRGVNAADKQLLRLAHRLFADGITHVILCTHDGDLANMPGSYELILTGNLNPARKLLAGATAVRQLSCDAPVEIGLEANSVTDPRAPA